MVSACTAQTPRRAKDSSRLLPLPTMSGWLVLALAPHQDTLALRRGWTKSLLGIRKRTYDGDRRCQTRFPLGKLRASETWFGRGANIPNSSLGGAMYTVSFREIAGGRGGVVSEN